MSILKPEDIFLILLLVIPGLISQETFNFFISRSKKRQIEVYRCILHSIIVYIIVYIAVAFIGIEQFSIDTIRSFITSNRWYPLFSVVGIAFISVVWGFIYAVYYQKSMKLIPNFNIVEPPNVSAALIDKKYQSKKELNKKFWITLPIDEGFIEGCIELVSFEENPREVYITKVAYLDKEKNIINRLPDNTGVILKIDDFKLIELTTVIDEELHD